jgi:hypothetical protein
MMNVLGTGLGDRLMSVMARCQRLGSVKVINVDVRPCRSLDRFKSGIVFVCNEPLLSRVYRFCAEPHGYR